MFAYLFPKLRKVNIKRETKKHFVVPFVSLDLTQFWKDGRGAVL